MSENNNSANATQELDSFVEVFTAGLEPDQIDEKAPSATPTEEPDAKSEAPVDNQDSAAPTDSDNSPTANDTDTQNQQKPESSSDKKVPETDEKKNEDVEEIFTKSDKAFAELRVANKTQGDLLLRMTRLANIDAKNSTEAIKMLSEHLDKIEARHGNLTYDEVERIRQSDKEQAEQKAQLQEQARSGFNKLKELHGLDQSAVYAFAEELKEKGVNPFEVPVDLVAQYRSMHYDQLLSAAREEGKAIGRQEELARREKAKTQSTTPITRQGGTNTGESLNSTDKLRAFLEN